MIPAWSKILLAPYQGGLESYCANGIFAYQVFLNVGYPLHFKIFADVKGEAFTQHTESYILAPSISKSYFHIEKNTQFLEPALYRSLPLSIPPRKHPDIEVLTLSSVITVTYARMTKIA